MLSSHLIIHLLKAFETSLCCYRTDSGLGHAYSFVICCSDSLRQETNLALSEGSGTCRTERVEQILYKVK